MTIGKPRGKQQKFPVWVYDPEIKSKRYIGQYATREEAEAAHQRVAGFPPRRCQRCLKKFRPNWETQVLCSTTCERQADQRRRPYKQRPQAPDHWVYTAADKHGEVLYIGVTSAGIRRHQEHAKTSGWWPLVATIRVEHYPTREQALAREADLLKTIQPQCNKHGTVATGSKAA